MLPDIMLQQNRLASLTKVFISKTVLLGRPVVLDPATGSNNCTLLWAVLDWELCPF